MIKYRKCFNLGMNNKSKNLPGQKSVSIACVCDTKNCNENKDYLSGYLQANYDFPFSNKKLY